VVDEHGKNRERIGELVDRLGMKSMLEATGLPPVPQMVKAPRTKPLCILGTGKT